MTRRQRQVLACVNDVIARTGVSPSTAEIGALLGVSTGVVSEHLRRLIADGYVRRTRFGRAVRSLQVLRMPGNGLSAVEAAWCVANPERVRAMMALVGAPPDPDRVPVRMATAAPGPGEEQAVAIGLRHIELMDPGDAVEIDLPSAPAVRRRCYLRLSTVATRLWGPGGAVRRSTLRGMHLQRTGAAG